MTGTLRTSCAAALVLLAAAGCVSTRVREPQVGEGLRPATATLSDASGRRVATAQLRPEGDLLRLRVDASGLRGGVYGIHIHDIGQCAAPDFASAGPHWNPTGAQHGVRNPAGPHAGDLPNLFVGTGGNGTLEATVPGRGLMDGNGAALVIHAQADDYRTDPSGDSGARIACGVFAPST